MPVPALFLPIFAAAAAAQAPARPDGPIVVTGHGGPPFISPMGEPFRARAAGQDSLADWFHQADRNRDGALTIEEMQADAVRFFAEIDGDSNGDIDPDEIVKYEWSIAPEIQVNSKFRRARGATGEPSPASSKAGREEPYEIDGRPQGAARYALLNIPQPVAAADANFDRSITIEEFRQAATARFQLLDTGRLGRLSLLQLQALRPVDPVSGRPLKPRKGATDTRYGLPLPPGN